MCCTFHPRSRLGGGHATLVPAALRCPPAPQQCPSGPSLSPEELLQVSDPANVGLFPCCFPGWCLREMLLLWCPQLEESFDSGYWPWLCGFGGGILPPALPWSLKRVLVLLPSPLPCKLRSRAGFSLSLFPFIHLIQTLNVGISFQVSDSLGRCTPESRMEN